MLQITFNSTDVALNQNLARKMPRLVSALTLKMDALNLLLAGYIQTKHLSGPTGPDSLSSRTGALRNSVRTILAKATADTIEGGVQGAGGTQFYGRIQEEGVDHSWKITAVNKKALAFMLDGKQVHREERHPSTVAGAPVVSLVSGRK